MFGVLLVKNILVFMMAFSTPPVFRESFAAARGKSMDPLSNDSLLGTHLLPHSSLLAPAGEVKKKKKMLLFTSMYKWHFDIEFRFNAVGGHHSCSLQHFHSQTASSGNFIASVLVSEPRAHSTAFDLKDHR